jgi:AcrR family transcriptional regulator
MISRMERKKEKKKKAIMDAAEEIIAAKGFGSLTMDQVAEDADVAKGTLYLYFKNKESLCATVNAQINREINQLMLEKMSLKKMGTKKIIASGTAIIEFARNNPKKWKVVTELYQLDIKDHEDPNVQEFLEEVNNMVQMLAEAYQLGIEEGTIISDLDPVPTAIYNRIAFINAFSITSEQKMILKRNNISKERYLSVVWNLLNRSTHVKSSIRVDAEKAQEIDYFEDSGKEMKNIIDSIGLPAEDAIELFDAWEHVTRIMMGKTEYEILNANKDRLIFHVISCPIREYEKIDVNDIFSSDYCSEYCKSVVETLNPKYTQRFTKQMCAGDEYCESIVELKNDMKSEIKQDS